MSPAYVICLTRSLKKYFRRNTKKMAEILELAGRNPKKKCWQCGKFLKLKTDSKKLKHLKVTNLSKIIIFIKTKTKNMNFIFVKKKSKKMKFINNSWFFPQTKLKFTCHLYKLYLSFFLFGFVSHILPAPSPDLVTCVHLTRCRWWKGLTQCLSISLGFVSHMSPPDQQETGWPIAAGEKEPAKYHTH